jgi:mRNA-degrading endonuclease RelE of RelBE toxin-antitoxin system
MKLSLTYSAYREMEQIPGPPLREISAAIVSLAEDPLPSGAAVLEGQGGCHFLSIDGYRILYHIDSRDGALTVLGVVDGSLHTVH